MEDIQVAIRTFASGGKQRGLLIRGRWGSGKTHAVREALSGSSKGSAIPHLNVSMYGRKSTTEIDTAIVAAYLADKTSKVSGGLTRLLQSAIHSVKADDLISHVAKEVARETLLCIDDVERKDDALSLRSLVGYIDLLNNTYGIRTICVVSVDRLSADEQSWLATNAEKTFPCRLLIEPTTDDVCAVVRLEAPAYQSDFHDAIRRLQLRNIRTAVEAAEKCNAFIGFAGHIDEPAKRLEVANHILTVCIAVAAMSGDAEFPSLAFIRSYKEQRSKPAAERSTEDQAWLDKLAAAQFGDADELDLIILQSVERGYFSKDQIRSFVEQLGALPDGSFSVVWREFHTSFDPNTEGFVSRLMAAAREHLSRLSPRKINSTIQLLNYLNQSDLADALSNEYADQHATSDPRDLDLTVNKDIQYPNKWEPNFQAAMQRQLVARITKLDIADILSTVGQRRFVDDYQMRRLASASEAEFIDSLGRVEPDLRPPALEACLIRNALRIDANAARMTEIVTSALRQLGSASTLNAVRVSKKYGIKLDEA